ncbi:MAG: hypothetical protein KDK01_02075 [Rhodobacteraceae bacterium]|jgi:hypothetical protein|nr:hypothetical protein [Paracoccaceae bacterium]
MIPFRSIKAGLLIAAAGFAMTLAGAGSAAAQQCPDWQLGGVPVSADAQTPQTYMIYAGGSLDLRQCGTISGVGYLTAAPTFSIAYQDLGMGRDLTMRVESDCDTTLLVNSASGEWMFNDDDTSMNPGLRLSAAPSGRYDVWVGTYSQQACQASLIVEAAGSPPPSMCPDWSLGGLELSMMTGQSGTQAVTAGGPISLFDGTCDIPAHGYLTAAPTISLYLDTGGQVTTLDLGVTGECDQTLLVNDPAGNWVFNDDDVDLHPRLQIGDADPGRYDIWVGTFGANGCASQLAISATSPQAPQGQPPAQGK